MKEITNTNSSGFSLLELLIAIFVATLIGIAAISLLNARAAGVVENKDFQEAEARTEESLSALTAIASDLPIGGTFTVVEDNRIELNEECSERFCDYVLFPDAPEELRTSPAKGVPFSSQIPENYQIMFVRRWRVESLDENYGLRKVTLALMKDDQSQNPIILESAVETLSR